MMSTIPPKEPSCPSPTPRGRPRPPAPVTFPDAHDRSPSRWIDVGSLAEQLSKDEDVIAFGDPELEGIAAVVILTLRSAGIPAMAEERDDASGSIGLDLYTFMQPDREWPLAQIALEGARR
jgi:hypothetical protein